MAQIYGYIRTSRRLQEGVPGMDPASQELQLRRAGVPLDCIHRDVGVSGTTGTQERRGWHRLNGRLSGGDTLVVVAIDRIGRRWADTIRSICELRDRGVKVRSLADAEKEWTRYLEAGRREPRSLLRPDPHDVRRLGGGPRAGVRQAEDPGRYGAGPTAGKTLGPPRKLRPGQVDAIRRMREEGASLRRIAADFECSASTVLRSLRREGVSS